MSSKKAKELVLKASQKSTASRNSESEETDTSDQTAKIKLGGRDLSHEKIDPNHWVVHGKKFDLTKWMHKHPGGEHAISFGRGRECTALIEQYHPFSDKVWEVLKKHEVREEGQEEDIDEAWPPKDPFLEDCKQVLRDHFPGGPKTAKGTSRVFKLWLFGTSIMAFFAYHMIQGGCVMAAFLAGVTYGVVHTRILHEGSHFSLTNNQTFNRVISYIYSYPTICITSWELQHVINHHQYTNYMNEEADEIQLVDIDAIAYDGICAFANSLDVSRTTWQIIVTCLIPFVFIQTPFGVGPINAYSLLKRKALINGDSVKVKSH